MEKSVATYPGKSYQEVDSSSHLPRSYMSMCGSTSTKTAGPTVLANGPEGFPVHNQPPVKLQ